METSLLKAFFLRNKNPGGYFTLQKLTLDRKSQKLSKKKKKKKKKINGLFWVGLFINWVKS